MEHFAECEKNQLPITLPDKKQIVICRRVNPPQNTVPKSVFFGFGDTPGVLVPICYEICGGENSVLSILTFSPSFFVWIARAIELHYCQLAQITLTTSLPACIMNHMDQDVSQGDFSAQGAQGGPADRVAPIFANCYVDNVYFENIECNYLFHLLIRSQLKPGILQLQSLSVSSYHNFYTMEISKSNNYDNIPHTKVNVKIEGMVNWPQHTMLLCMLRFTYRHPQEYFVLNYVMFMQQFFTAIEFGTHPSLYYDPRGATDIFKQYVNWSSWRKDLFVASLDALPGGTPDKLDKMLSVISYDNYDTLDFVHTICERCK